MTQQEAPHPESPKEPTSSAAAPKKTLTPTEEVTRQRESREKQEALSHIREGFMALKKDHPTLKVDDCYKQLEKSPLKSVQSFSEVIFDFYDLSSEGIKIFNQLVDAGKSFEIVYRVVGGVSLLSRCRDVYHAPMEVLDAGLVSLQNLQKPPSLNFIQAKPGVLRATLQIQGKFFTWDTGGTIHRTPSPREVLPKEVPSKDLEQEPEDLEVSQEESDAFMHATLDDAEADTVEERLERFRTLLLTKEFTEDGSYFCLNDLYVENTRDALLGMDFIWSYKGEKEDFADMSTEEVREYLANTLMPRMAEQLPPEKFLDLQ